MALAPLVHSTLVRFGRHCGASSIPHRAYGEVPACPRLKMAADRRHPTHMCIFEVDTTSGLANDAESEFTEITWIGYTIVDFKERDVSDTLWCSGRMKEPLPQREGLFPALAA